MGVIKATSNTQYFHKRNSSVFALDESEGGSEALSDGRASANMIDGKDHFEISANTRTVLQSISEEFDKILSQHPGYEHLFLANEDASNKQVRALAFMAQFRSFLANPQYQQLAEHDDDFAGFFQKVNDLGKLSQAALTQTQQSLREHLPNTYARPKRIQGS
jgi:hypothetical protein